MDFGTRKSQFGIEKARQIIEQDRKYDQSACFRYDFSCIDRRVLLLVQAAPVENAEVVSLLGIFTYAIAAFVIIFLAIDALIQMYKKRKK